MMLVSFPSLEFDVVDDTPLIDLEKAFGYPLISLPFVDISFSNTPTNTTISASLLLSSPLYLDQCMGLEMGENFRVTLVLQRMLHLLGQKSLYSLSHIL